MLADNMMSLHKMPNKCEDFFFLFRVDVKFMNVKENSTEVGFVIYDLPSERF